MYSLLLAPALVLSSLVAPAAVAPDIVSTVVDPCVANCFLVDAYGADSAGVLDSTSSIQAAIDDAADYTDSHPSDAATVVLSAGTYRITGGLLLDSVQNISVQGAGADATLIRLDENEAHHFQVEDSSSVRIEGLTVDRSDANLPWTQFTVLDTSGYNPADPNGYLDVQVDSGYPSLSDAMFDAPGAGVLGFAEETDGNLSVRYFGPGTSVDPLDSTQWRYEVSPGVWRVHFFNISWNTFFPGQRIALITATHAGMAFAFERNVGVEVIDVTNRASSFMGLWSHGMEDLTIDGYRGVPGAGRMLSSTRDGVHLTGYNRGQLIIRNSTFARSGDDAINYTMIEPSGVQVVSDSEVVLDSDVALVGDEIEVYSKATRELLGATTVLAMSGGNVTFSSPIVGMSNGDLFQNKDASFKDAVIENNTFLNHRGRGVVPRGIGVTIAGNTFKDVPQAMLITTVANDAGEGPITRDVTITDNIFENVTMLPAIEIGGEAFPTASRDSAVGYLIEGNEFKDMTHPAMILDLAEDVEILNNRVEIAPGGPLDVIQLGRSVGNLKSINIDGLEVQAAGITNLHSVVNVVKAVDGLSIANIGGHFTAPQFLNNLAQSVDFNSASTTSTIGPTGPQVEHFWDFAGSTTEGWSNGQNIGIQAVGGALAYETVGADASIMSPTSLGIDAAANRYLKFSLENPSAGDVVEVFFTTDTDGTMNYAKEVSVAVTPSTTERKEYVVDMGANVNWSGTIDRLRIDVPDQTTGGDTGRIDYILLDSSPLRSFSNPTWDFETGLGGMSLYNIASSSVSGGVFSYTSTANPIIITQRPLNLEASEYSFIKVVLKNTAPGSRINVFFTTDAEDTPSESKRLSVSAAPSSTAFTTYYIDTNNLKWTGKILDLRFDLPTSGGSSFTSQIDSITLVGDASVDGLRTGLVAPQWSYVP